jgi:hypothetical protein
LTHASLRSWSECERKGTNRVQFISTKFCRQPNKFHFNAGNQCAQLRGDAPASAPSLSWRAFFDTAGTLRRSRIAISRMGTPVPQSFRSVETSCSDHGRVSGGRKKVIVLNLSCAGKSETSLLFQNMYFVSPISRSF